MYRLLLAFLCLVCLIGAIGGNPADMIALAVVGNGLVGVHGWIHGQGYGGVGLWRALFGLDALVLGYYGTILVGAEGGPPGWSLLLMLALIFGPMLYALLHYGWRSAQIWDAVREARN
jgi:hypothetical protein